MIATGSDVARLPGVRDRREDGHLLDRRVEPGAPPKKLIVVGAGVIGLELGSVWRRLGSEVDGGRVSRPCPDRDGRRGRQAYAAYAGEAGLRLSPRPQAGESRNDRSRRQGDDRAFSGRRGARRSTPTSCSSPSAGARSREGLGLEAVGVKTERGQVVVDAHFATSVPGIYAIGDAIRGPMLAHKARGRGRRGRRAAGGAGGPRQLRRHSQRRLHQPGGRFGRQDRGRAKGRGRRLRRRQIPVHRQRAGAGDAAHRRLRQDPRRRRHRSRARRAYRRASARAR